MPFSQDSEKNYYFFFVLSILINACLLNKSIHFFQDFFYIYSHQQVNRTFYLFCTEGYHYAFPFKICIYFACTVVNIKMILPSKWLSGRVGTTSSHRPFSGTTYASMTKIMNSLRSHKLLCNNSTQFANTAMFCLLYVVDFWPIPVASGTHHHCTQWSNAPQWGRTPL